MGGGAVGGRSSPVAQCAGSGSWNTAAPAARIRVTWRLSAASASASITGPKAGGPHYLRRLVHSTVAPAATAIDAAMVLPGPTGESNMLSLHPRGRVACIADDAGALRVQLRLATATGNVALLTRSSLTETVAAGLRDRKSVV